LVLIEELIAIYIYCCFKYRVLRLFGGLEQFRVTMGTSNLKKSDVYAGLFGGLKTSKASKEYSTLPAIVINFFLSSGFFLHVFCY